MKQFFVKAPVAQLEEQIRPKDKVAGSIPVWGVFLRLYFVASSVGYTGVPPRSRYTSLLAPRLAVKKSFCAHTLSLRPSDIPLRKLRSL